MAHVRLSILDLSSLGNQPMASADGRYVISYNGEVYNFKEIASELSLSNLRSHSDTEVILRAFAKIGLASLVKLNGMFAFAMYDKQLHKLWLVRDRLGIKPLYYRLDSRSLAFASEIKGILALTEDAPVCDLNSLHEWLYYGNSLGGRTLYKDIKQLLPGQYLEFDLESFKSELSEYWSLKRQAGRKTAMGCDRQDIIAETQRLLEQAVKRQLVSDVPVGLFLSGGVDSSAIAAFASRHYKGRLATYSAGFDFARDGGELPQAKLVASLFGTEHHEIHIAGGDVGGLVEKMVYHHDMPFSDAANIPLHLMALQISGQTKVVLQGDGGDELFGGYRRYSTLTHYRWMHPMARAFEQLLRVTPKSAFLYRVQRYLHAIGAKDLATTMALLLTFDDQHLEPAAMFSPQLRRVIELSDPFARYRECQRMFVDHDIGNQMSFVDLMIILPDIYLEKVDRSTMAASLEVRVPFLDNDLVDFVVGLPSHLKIPLGKKKWLLKSALRGIVPDKILYGPKRGFNVPFAYWLRTSLKPLFYDHLAKFTRERPDVLNTAKVHEMYATMGGGADCRSDLLWNLLNFMIWCNNSKVCIDV
jgi:asparagine synthase (glutamine-hydrolysing)